MSTTSTTEMPPPSKVALAQRFRHAAHLDDLAMLVEEPGVRIDLMHSKTRDNDPFYSRIVREFYADARAPHPKVPVVGRFTFGVALCRLPDRFEDYFALVEGSARRNFHKAERTGYRFERIDFNAYLDDIAEIRRSRPVRQGPMPQSLLSSAMKPISDPPSRSDVHDYPWFGVLHGEKLVAYASCLVAGEMCMITHIFGHAGHQQAGVVSRLIIGIASYIYGHYPHVKYFAYDMYFGASPSLRRFKKKLGFSPYRVRWVLDAEHDLAARRGPERELAPREAKVEVPGQLDYQLIYRRRLGAPAPVEPVPGAVFHYLDRAAAVALIAKVARNRFSLGGLVKAAAKLATPSRQYFCVVIHGSIASDGWVTLGRCDHYPISRDEAVIGPVWTHPAHRGKGLATFALRSALNALFDRGWSVTYIDTSRDNVGMQKAIVRAGYGAPVALHLRH